MISDAQFAAWLQNPDANPVTLFDANPKSGGVEVTRRMSSGYFPGAAGDPEYLPCVTAAVKLTNEIPVSQGADASLNAGDLIIGNPDGSLDSWAKDVWVNCTLSVLIGDETWSRADFRVIQTLAVAKLVPKGRDSFSLKIVNKLQRLNTPITDAVLGGTGENADAVIPQCFGECHNVAPLCIDANNLIYRVHSGAVELIKEVRVNGVPVNFIPNHAAGTFQLTVPPPGVVTCSVQGAKVAGVYLRTIAQIIKHIATTYGKDSDRFALSDIDTANFDAYDAAHQQTVGLYVNDRMNVLDACNQLARSLNSVVTVSNMGQLRMYQYREPTVAALTLDETNYYDQSLALIDLSDVVAAVKIGYAKNWTVQDKATLGGLPEAHKDMFAKEYYEKFHNDNVIRDAYKLYFNTEPRPTLLMGEQDAQDEVDRLFSLFSNPRGTYVVEGTRELATLECGTQVILKGNRYGLEAGTLAVVTKVIQDWLTYNNQIEVTI